MFINIFTFCNIQIMYTNNCSFQATNIKKQKKQETQETHETHETHETQETQQKTTKTRNRNIQ